LLPLIKRCEEEKLDVITCILVSGYLEVVFLFKVFFTNIKFFYDFIFYKSEVRTVLFEVGIVLGLLKKSYLKLAKLF